MQAKSDLLTASSLLSVPTKSHDAARFETVMTV